MDHPEPISSDSDLAPERVAALLATDRFGREYHAFAKCGSTNDEAARLARMGAPEGTVVVAETQSGGRGRLGRTWHSPPGASLYLSAILRPQMLPHQLPPITLAAGAALAKAADRAMTALNLAGKTPPRPILKWPNDLQFETQNGRRKCAGILTEMSSDQRSIHHLILGIGININGTEFPPELADKATSLTLVAGTPLGTIDRATILCTLLEEIESAYTSIMTGTTNSILETWRSYARFGESCEIEHGGTRIRGTSLDIDEQGALLVRTETVERLRVVSGEVL